MKTFEAFVNKSRYTMLVIRIEELEDGYLFQRMCFEHGIYWSIIGSKDGTKERFLGSGGDNYLYIKLAQGKERLYRSDEYEEDFVKQFKIPDKIFTIADFNEVKSILEVGSAPPSYAPRRIDRTLESLNESHYYINNNELPEDDMPKYKIGDVVKFREKAEQIQLSASSNYWGFVNTQKRFVEDNKGKPLTIVQKYSTGPDMMNPLIRNKWFSAFSSSIPGISIMWFLDETIEPAVVTPNYSPRRINRTLESVISDKKKMVDVIFRIEDETEGNHAKKVLIDNGFELDIDAQDSIDRKGYPCYFYLSMVNKYLSYLNGDPNDNSLISAIKSINKSSKDYKINEKIFKFSDMKYINSILLTGNIGPTYEPRRINRTLESNGIGKYYNEITKEYTDWPYRFKTEKEFSDTCEPSGDDWYCGSYLFVQGMHHLFGKTLKRDFPDNFGYVQISDNFNNWYVTKQMLTDNKISAPSYAPRKIDRTLEANKYWPYRFKTREEFIKDYGMGWKNRIQLINPTEGVGVSWSSQMDDLLGQPCKVEDIDMSVNQRYHLPTSKIDRGFWIITNEMITKNRATEPNYRPRRIDRTLESVGDTLWREIAFELKNNEDAKFVQEELFRRGYHWWTDIKEVKYFSHYPEYLFVEFERNEISAANLRELESSTIDEYIKNFNRSSGMKAINPKVFNPRDVINIESIRVRGEAAPSYAPRKIDNRIDTVFEKFVNKSKFNKIQVEVHNHEESRKIQELCFSLGIKWCDHTTEYYEFLDSYPIYIWIYMNDGEMTFSNDGDDKNMKNLYQFEDYNIIKSILTKGGIVPDYSPRKIDRTL